MQPSLALGHARAIQEDGRGRSKAGAVSLSNPGISHSFNEGLELEA